jgi:uncharacterized membrane protein
MWRRGSAFVVRMKHITQKQRRQLQYAKRKKIFVLAFCIIVIPSMAVMFAQALAHLRSGDRTVAWDSYGSPVGYFVLLIFSIVFLSLAVIAVFRVVMSKHENRKPDDGDGTSS